MESPRDDTMGGLIEYLKSKDGAVLTSWTKVPHPWTLHSYNKIVATIDTISASAIINTGKSDRVDIPKILEADYKCVNKNELKFTADSWQYCSSEAEKQFVTLVGNILYYFQCARMLQLSSTTLFFNFWRLDHNHRVDVRMKFRGRLLKFLEGRQEKALFCRLLSDLREYTRDMSVRDKFDTHFNGLVITLEDTVKELCMIMSIALRFETWALPVRINEFTSDRHFPVLRCIGRGITLSEAVLIAEEGAPMHRIVPADSAVVFGTVGGREFVIWKPRGSHELHGSTVLVWSTPLSVRAVSYIGDNEDQKWLFSISCAVIIDFCLQKERYIHARGSRLCGTQSSPFFVVLDIFHRLGPKILERMPSCKNRAMNSLVTTLFDLSKKGERSASEEFTSDRIDRSLECLRVVMEQWLLPSLGFEDPFKDHFLHVLARRHVVSDAPAADEIKDEQDGNTLSVTTDGDAIVKSREMETEKHSPLFFGSKRAAEVSDEFVESIFDAFCESAPNACATLPSGMALDSKRSNLDNLLFDIIASNIMPCEDSSERLSSFIDTLKCIFYHANELIAELFVSKLILLGQFLISPDDPHYRKVALTSFGVNIQNSYEVVRQDMLKEMSASSGGRGLDMLDWKVREQLTQDVIDFCIIVRFSTPKQSILHYINVGGVFAFDKMMMTALDGNVEDGEACRMLVPPVCSQPKDTLGEMRSDTIAPIPAPISKAVVIPV